VTIQHSFTRAPYDAHAALSDALSTAFMIMEPAEIKALCERYPGVEALGLL
jgi:thiamine biosynthesis lipoprotein ApbE